MLIVGENKVNNVGDKRTNDGDNVKFFGDER